MRGPTALVDFVAFPQWVAWRNEMRNGQWTKVPYCSATRQAEADDASSWLPHDQAALIADVIVNGSGGGIGIELGQCGERWITGVDLDTCRDPVTGIIEPWAVEVIERLNSYTEVSPSETGVKVFLLSDSAEVPKLRHIMGTPHGRQFKRANGSSHPPSIELYLSNRYFTVTWEGLADTPADLRVVPLEDLRWLIEEVGPTFSGKRDRANGSPGTNDTSASILDRLDIAAKHSKPLAAALLHASTMRGGSRSEGAFGLGAALKRAGWTCADMKAALLACPATKEWAGEADDRQFERIWARSDDEAKGESAPGSWFDPWEEPAPPEWPGGILTRQHEETLASVSLRDGVDYGVLCLAYITAASGAAPKNSRFAPYGADGWWVPPIFWMMVIAESGQRKTAIKDTALSPLQDVHNGRWQEFMGEMRAYRKLSEAERRDTEKPAEPHSYIVNDCTVEKLQLILAANPRGTMLLKDELAGFFDFGRYTAGPGAAERAFYLEAYEGAPYTVHRVGRDSIYIQVTGITMYGNIQPDRLADFKGLESDGMMQRIAPICARPASIERPDIKVTGLEQLQRIIRQLTSLSEKFYTTTKEGSDLIKQTGREAKEYAEITENGPGFRGFCRKLHGAHARLALILHMIDDPEQIVIPTETVKRAYRLVRYYLLRQAHGFYSSSIPGSANQIARDIGGWLLTKAPDDRILASDLVHNVKACRSIGAKGIAQALEPFVIGGWLEPQNDFPSNRIWKLNPNVRNVPSASGNGERISEPESDASKTKIRQRDFRDGNGGYPVWWEILEKGQIPICTARESRKSRNLDATNVD
jgi:hypothetical protein